MQDLAGKAPVGRLALTAGEVTSEAYQPRLEAFAKGLQPWLAGHHADAAENAARKDLSDGAPTRPARRTVEKDAKESDRSSERR
jgi:hypothetical protein